MKLKQLRVIEEFTKFLLKEDKPDEILEYLKYRVKSIDHDYVIPLEVFADDSNDSDFDIDEYIKNLSSEEEDDLSDLTDEEVFVEKCPKSGRCIEIKLSL